MKDWFKEKLQEFIFSTNDWQVEKSISKFWEENYIEIEKNIEILLEILREYAPSRTQDFQWYFYKILYFFQFKEEKKFYSKDIVDFFKSELIFQRNTDKPKFYSNILYALIAIESDKAKEEFYENEFQEIKKKRFIYSDIYSALLEVFIILWKNKNSVFEEFSEIFSQLIIMSVDEVISFSIDEGWKYICSLEKKDFNIEFFKILDYFDSDEKREQLEHHNKYTSIFTLDKYSKEDKRFEKIRAAIEWNFWNTEYKKFKKFIISEVNYLLDVHERAIHENTFVSQGIDMLQKREKTFIITLLKNIESEKTLWWLEKTIVEYISEDQIEDFIKILKGTENDFTIFRVYERAQEDKKNKLVTALEKSSYKKEIIQIQEQRWKQQEKYKKEEEKRIQQEKNDFFQMLIPPKEWVYYPKLFQDYVEYSTRKNQPFHIFSKSERKRIDKAVILQIETYFSYRNMNEYSEKWHEYVTFEQTEENSYSHCWDSQYMNWFLQIAQILPQVKKILQEHYKVIILFYPLMYGDDIEEYFFNEIIWDNIDNDDIAYILKVYSQDLHENAKGLRFYHSQNFVHFYEKFSINFKWFEKQVEKISDEMLHEKEKLNEYYRYEFLKIYAEVIGEKKYRAYWKKLEKKYPNFNYFRDILENISERSTEELKEMRFFLMTQTILVEKYAKKSDILWRINQIIKTEPIQATSRFRDDYPHYKWVTSWVGWTKSDELEWMHPDKEDFAYIFFLENVWKIDVSKDMLRVLERSLEIKSQEEKDTNLFVNYLQKVFFKYFEIFDDNLLRKSFFQEILDFFWLYVNLYEKILWILWKFPAKFTYNFNLSFFKQKLSKGFLKNEAIRIISRKDYSKIELLLALEEEKKNQKINSFTPIEENKKKPGQYIIFVEWPTDIKYIKYASEILDEQGILEWVEFRIIWKESKKWWTISSSDKELKTVSEYYLIHSDLGSGRFEKIIFLHDPENKINEESIENIYIRKMQSKKNKIIYKWIESLFSKKTIISILDKISDEEKSKLIIEDFKRSWGDFICEKIKIIDGQKTAFLELICKNAKKEDFEWFQHIFDMLREILWLEKREEK